MEGEHDKFKSSFKYYKRRKPPPSFDNVIDFEVDLSKTEQIIPLDLKVPDLPTLEGLTPVDSWKAFGVKTLPGFYFIKNPFTPPGQRYWIHRCLHDFPCKPNVCNLDAHMSLDRCHNVWNASLSNWKSHDQTRSELKQVKRSQGQQQSQGQQRSLMDQLRWVTLGYHHNWDTKHYIPDHASPFPPDLGYLSRYIVEAAVRRPVTESIYTAQAAIINYYHMDSTLAGHTDHSEYDLQAPLLSASFGQSAIFLVGGTTKTTEPVAMFLRSGDIAIMADESRLAYHAIPKVLSEHPGELPPCIRPEMSSEPLSLAHALTGKCPAGEVVIGSAETLTSKATPTTPEPSRKVLKTNDMTEVRRRCEVEVPECGGRGDQASETLTAGKLSADQFVPRTERCDRIVGERPKEPSVPSLTMPTTISEDDLSSCVSQMNEYIRYQLDHINFVPFGEYLKTSRVNMNVRQVFRNGQSFKDVELKS